MIISNSKKFIFVHIPKCAGTSVTRALEPCQGWNDIFLGCTEFGSGVQSAYNEKFGLEKHSSVQNIVNVIGEKVWSDYFTFTFVRNPFRRIVSWYTFARRIFENQNYLRKKVSWLYTLFDKPTKTDAPVVKAYQDSRSFSEFLHHEGCFGDDGTMSQVEWLWKGEDRDRIPLDFVGRVESIDKDFERISNRIGVEASLPRQNVSSTVSHERFYESDEDVKIVVEKYAQDFDRLGYEKTLAKQ